MKLRRLLKRFVRVFGAPRSASLSGNTSALVQASANGVWRGAPRETHAGGGIHAEPMPGDHGDEEASWSPPREHIRKRGIIVFARRLYFRTYDDFGIAIIHDITVIIVQ